MRSFKKDQLVRKADEELSALHRLPECLKAGQWRRRCSWNGRPRVPRTWRKSTHALLVGVILHAVYRPVGNETTKNPLGAGQM
jgi:hypothetical protein